MKRFGQEPLNGVVTGLNSFFYVTLMSVFSVADSNVHNDVPDKKEYDVSLRTTCFFIDDVDSKSDSLGGTLCPPIVLA